jgi:hypothetical protein
MTAGVRLLLGLSFLCCLPHPALAQLTVGRTNPTIRFEFNYSNPGARSLAMGGAFAALADDATAAYTNPAGLSNLARPEFSVEQKWWQEEISFLDSYYELRPEPHGNVRELVVDEYLEPETRVGLSFASLVWPSLRWTLGLYYHRLANFQGDFDGFPHSSRLRNSRVDLSINGFGAVVSYKINDRIAIGAGVVAYDFDYRSQILTEHSIDSNEPAQRFDRLIQRGQRIDVRGNFGILANLTRRLTAGAFIRQGPGVELFEDVVKDIYGTNDRYTKPVGQFRAPTVAGLGFAFRPDVRCRIIFEYDLVRYSEILSKGDSHLYSQLPDRPPVLEGTFSIEDAHELRVGAEYSFWHLPTSPALRIGVWYDPDHSIRFKANPRSWYRNLEAFYTGRKDRWHFCFGGGIVIRNRIQIDVGVDLSDGRDAASLSAVFRF